MSKSVAIATGPSSDIGLELAAVAARQHRRMAEFGSATHLNG